MKRVIGIDWGTHSSKWCYQDTNKRTIVGQIWNSAVWREGDQLSMYAMNRRHKGNRGESGLKRKLIQDPDQAFWEGSRPKLGVTLGEATVFSLHALLSDAHDTLKRMGAIDGEVNDLTYRFSHPNWISPDKVTALSYYRDAAVVALSSCGYASSWPIDQDVFHLSIPDIRNIVVSHQKIITALLPLPQLYDHSKYQSCLRGTISEVVWELVFESCAAGFPYLVETEPELFDPDTFEESQHQWVRKILVVDIGAGSTDAGYMLRTIKLDPRTQKPVSPLLIWLPAHDALEKAGNWLSDRIREDRIKQGYPNATLDEAEDYKTSGVTDWHGKQYLSEWCEAIAGHIADYISVIPDKTRLPKTPPLQVVVTGGSSAVPKVKEHILERVKDALRARGVGAGVCDASSLILPSISTLRGGGSTEIQCAQLAVCFGASHPRFAELTHYPKGVI